MFQATSLFPSRALPAHFRCAPHPYSAPDSQNLRARSRALFLLAPLVKPDQVSLGGHPFSRLQGTHPLQRYWERKDEISRMTKSQPTLSTTKPSNSGGNTPKSGQAKTSNPPAPATPLARLR